MQINANILMIVQQSDRFDATAVSSMILKINQTKLRDGWKWLDLSHIANWTQMGRLIEYFMQKEFFFDTNEFRSNEGRSLGSVWTFYLRNLKDGPIENGCYLFRLELEELFLHLFELVSLDSFVRGGVNQTFFEMKTATLVSMQNHMFINKQ